MFCKHCIKQGKQTETQSEKHHLCLDCFKVKCQERQKQVYTKFLIKK